MERFLRGLEQWAGDHFETHIGKGGCDHVRAAIVPILPHFRDHNARFAAQTPLDGVDAIGHLSPALVELVGALVDARNWFGCCIMTAKDLFHS